ncbi:hypothetical protein ABT160_07515 [Streptomyces sp. NPDC001941]|uniref:hypothetical protein n=1 Tax=Streptomyces sp. NPDC001941 TaxID=3154659 RepID=UPI00331C5AA7
MATESLHFSWELRGAGWAVCRIWDGEAKHRDVVSYLTNALADLLGAVAGLYSGPPGSVRRVSFDLEPVESRWVLRPRDGHVHIEILHFPDTLTGDPDEKGKLVWTCTAPRTLLAHAVVRATEQVLRTHGETGYQEKWHKHPFPTAELEALRALHLTEDTCALPH